MFFKIPLACLAFFLSSVAQGFVFLSSDMPRLPVDEENPRITIVWNGSSPSISKKENYMDGAYADLGDDEFMLQLLQDSFAIWNDVEGSFLVMDVVEGEAHLDDTDGQFSLVVEGNSNLSVAAFAKPTYAEDDRSIIEDCDISVTDRRTSAKSLAYTLIHEIGHCLGLGHNHSNYNAIMGYSRSRRDLSLGADDKAGIIFLYPDTSSGAGEVKQLVSCGSIGGTRGVVLWWLLVIPGIVAAFCPSRRSGGHVTDHT